MRLPPRNELLYHAPPQDVMSRFTLDCATEFLFGTDVRSLSAGLPYPPGLAPAQTTTPFSQHPADRFSRAFFEAQKVSAMRGAYGNLWQLLEFFRDKTDEHMAVIDMFVEPVICEAIARKKTGGCQAKPGDDDTLLDHLVNYTEGASRNVSIIADMRNTRAPVIRHRLQDSEGRDPQHHVSWTRHGTYMLAMY